MEISDIKVNDKLIVKGEFSVSAIIDYSSRPPVIKIEGAFRTNTYIEDIHKLESNRYVVTNIKVNQESFGTAENVILYSFSASEIKVKKKEVTEN